MNNVLIIVVAVVSVAAAMFAWARLSMSTASPQPAASRDGTDFPPKPAWKPTLPVDIARTVQAFAYYTDRKKVFAVFRHGTCVLVPDASTDPDHDARSILDKVYRYHPDFNPRTMDDGHFLVSYSQPAFSVVFKDEFNNHRDYIEQHHLDGVVRAEGLLNAKGEPNKFDDSGKVGLFGRARMFLDAQDPIVVQVWKPKK